MTKYFDPKYLIRTYGTAGLILVIFLESGIVPAPLPGDSLLFTAGLFSVTKKNNPHLNFAVILVGSFIAAVAGAQVGYLIGKFLGHRLFKPGAKFFKPEYEARGHAFFERGGPRAVVLGRFIPFVRTVVPILAGSSEMSASTFFVFNVIGAALWAGGISIAGRLLGEEFEKHGISVDKYLLPIVAVIVILSLIPPVLEYRKHKREQASVKQP